MLACDRAAEKASSRPFVNPFRRDYFCITEMPLRPYEWPEKQSLIAGSVAGNERVNSLIR